MIDDKELIRRALLGDQQAQKECTKKGIVLPCPKCFKEIKVTSYCRRYYFVCDDCLIQFISALDESKSDAISRWNTRPAPPIGRCRECKMKEKATVNDKGFLICPASGMEIADNDFCSYFEPEE